MMRICYWSCDGCASYLRVARVVITAWLSTELIPRNRVASNVIANWRGGAIGANVFGPVMMLLLGESRVARRASPQSASDEEIIKFEQSRGGDAGRTETHAPAGDRSEERRVGEECVSTVGSRW